MKNPTDYNLKEGSFTVKDIDRIYDTLRRRARAAFKHQWSQITGPTDTFIAKKLKANAEAIEYGLTASWEVARKWADNSIAYMALTKEQAANKHWFAAQKLVNDSKRLIKNYEAECFSRVRGASHIKKLGERPLKYDGTWLSQVKAFMMRLSMAYPYVSKKNRHRLATALNRLVLKPADGGIKHRAVAPKQLLEFGIPAVEIAGPWWTKTKDIKRPMDWVERGVVSDADLGKAYSSPRATDWIDSIGLDSGDRGLVDAIKQYYEREGQAPSVEWARRRNNELEEERAQKDMEEQLPKVEEWLESSSYWRRGADYADITIPELPDPTFRVLKPGDGELLCRAAKKDGLCVVDSITNLVDETNSRARFDEDDDEAFTRRLYKKSEAENFVTLIISTDPKRRTVVGLNSKGVCSSEHHCTGISNKVDAVAYEYFRKPH